MTTELSGADASDDRLESRHAGPVGDLGAYFEWGSAGALALAATCAGVVVVDVLSFTTTVVIAASLGTDVFPCADDLAGRRLAAETGAQLAVSRHESDDLHPWSLSPVSVSETPPVARLVLPSPNGSAISAAVAGTGTPVIATCLRNVSAVVDWLLSQAFGSAVKPVAVIAAGERWADGSLRPAIEDLFAAGLVLDGLAAAGIQISAEASVAARSVAGLSQSRVADLVRASTSGTELRVAGYGGDVEIAVEMDVDSVVPVMTPEMAAFRDELVKGDRQ